MKAASYLRCSGETQVKGDTWARQTAAITKYAKANGIEVLREFRDEGVTGKMELENREGLSACIHFVRENGITLVLVEDSSRLARDLIVAEVIIREFQRAGVRLVCASGGIDLTAGDDSNPTAKLVRQILSAVAEFDRCVINLKLQSARARKRLSDPNYREGRPPYGYTDDERVILAKMREMRGNGVTFQGIADALNEGELPARSGKPWTVGAIGKILAR
jgi:DNA invertase Pin-like site-specific DNA recombinase